MSIETVAETQRAARIVLGEVAKDELSNSTPCTEWDVAKVIDHLLGSQRWFLQAISTPGADGGTSDVSAGDYRKAYDEAATAIMGALSADGFASREVELPFGKFSGAQFMDFVSLETLAHTWDVAKATGQDTDLAPEAAARLLDVAQAMMGAEGRSEDGNFRAVQPCPPDASAADRLAAFLGRRVNWTTPRSISL
jgi:uncharacterized protein (TIGR03086 family)